MDPLDEEPGWFFGGWCGRGGWDRRGFPERNGDFIERGQGIGARERQAGLEEGFDVGAG